MHHNARDPQEGRRTRFLLLTSVAATTILLVVLVLLLLTHRQPRPESPVYTPDFSRFASAELPLDRGLALVLVLSVDCSHCIETATEIGTFDGEAHGLRIYLMLLGQPEAVEPFFQTIGAWLPYRLVTPQEYAEFAGDDPPELYLLGDGTLRAQWSGSHFSLEALRAELQRGH